jgi:hypothetical protein
LDIGYWSGSVVYPFSFDLGGLLYKSMVMFIHPLQDSSGEVEPDDLVVLVLTILLLCWLRSPPPCTRLLALLALGFDYLDSHRRMTVIS